MQFFPELTTSLSSLLSQHHGTGQHVARAEFLKIRNIARARFAGLRAARMKNTARWRIYWRRHLALQNLMRPCLFLDPGFHDTSRRSCDHPQPFPIPVFHARIFPWQTGSAGERRSRHQAWLDLAAGLRLGLVCSPAVDPVSAPRPTAPGSRAGVECDRFPWPSPSPRACRHT